MPTMNEIYMVIGALLQINAPANKGISKTFQFEIGGSDPLDFFFKLEDGVPTTGLGKTDRPDVTLIMSSDTFMKLVEKKLNKPLAFITRKLRIKGDRKLAMQLDTILKR
ncbi:MAG: SCP2 sterol-binding domain-containing protein [Bacillota bacterium]